MVVVGENDFTNGAVPVEEQNRIAKSIQMIGSTIRGTVPYARNMGLEKILPRNNSEMEKNEYATELAEAIEEWEESVTVSEVSFTTDGETKVVIDYVE